MPIEAQQLRPQDVAASFVAAEMKFEEIKRDLASPRMAAMTHSEVERSLQKDGTELLRLLYQGFLDAQGDGAVAEPVRGPEGANRTHVREEGRNLMSLFGPVRIARQGYGAREASPLRPLDAELNLPTELYSLETRRRVAEEVAKNSFSESVQTIGRTTGAVVPKRQAEELSVSAAQDFDAFYREAERAAELGSEATGPILAITADGKGVVMRREDLREATRKAAEGREHKLTTRLSKGEKRNAKRMAEVAAVYTIEPHVRRPEDVIADTRPVRDADRKRPRPEHKRVWASLKKEPKEIIAEAYDEAERRDPHHRKTWVVLVDGNPTQLALVKAEAKARGVTVRIVVDFIHALEYLWKAGRALLGEGQDSEVWVKERALKLLRNEPSAVAAGIRRSATLNQLTGTARKAADDCADYLLKNSSRMRYGDCLALGLPIATGVIEGACRHLIKDRLDLTGARWRLDRAEAVLQLRALRSSGDFDGYWTFHEQQEQVRNHRSRYLGGIVPQTIRPTRHDASRKPTLVRS
jgi:hypothetical protein